MESLTSKSRNSNSSDNSTTNSSASSSSSSKKQHQQREKKMSVSRSRSFLHCISKHLGRHFLHNHHDAMYNSQEDLRSSSTDSFSLSFERGSHLDACHITNSNIDLTCEERTSSASSNSAYSRTSPMFCSLEASDELDTSSSYRYNGQQHIFLDTLYHQRSGSSLGRSSNNDINNSDSDEDEENINCGDVNRIRMQRSIAQHSTSAPTSSTTSRSMASASKGLHLSRISISSSVRSMFQHFSTHTSTRSLSCSSTPLRRVSDLSGGFSSGKSKKNSNKKSASMNGNGNSSTNLTEKKQKKAEKKQQSILRPPINYVNMKGMSGLYSRVPRYTVCCPYAMQQIA